MTVTLVAGSVLLALLIRAALRDGEGDGDGVAAPQPGLSLATALAQPGAAVSPFAGFTEARVGVGDECLRVVVADEQDERVQGLRGVRGTAPYDGMLFVFDNDSDARFTMADTLVALDITWYDAAGTPVSSTTMVPCPDMDAGCPTYAADRPYRYALETEAGSAAAGALGGCPA